MTNFANDGSATLPVQTSAPVACTVVYGKVGPYELPDDGSMYEFDTAVTTKTLRFNLMDTTGGNTGAVDIAVYGAFIDE